MPFARFLALSSARASRARVETNTTCPVALRHILTPELEIHPNALDTCMCAHGVYWVYMSAVMVARYARG